MCIEVLVEIRNGIYRFCKNSRGLIRSHPVLSTLGSSDFLQKQRGWDQIINIKWAFVICYSFNFNSVKLCLHFTHLSKTIITPIF